MLSKEIRKFIINPTLEKAGWRDDSSKVLIYGTGMIETKYQAVMQIGTPIGGGVGAFQEQPGDYKEIIVWLRNGFNRKIYDRILSICNFAILPSDVMFCAWNMAYATLICRVHYHRYKEPLPKPNDARGMAQYHYKYYNGNGEGKTDLEENVSVFQKIIDGEL